MKIITKNFQKKIPVDPKRIKKTILKLLSHEGIKKSGEITVSFVNDLKIRELNKRYLHKDIPTDVLVFDLADKGQPQQLLADIVISTDTAVRNAAIFDASPAQELELYLVHGLLHLAGYDDRSARQRKIMRKKESDYAHT